MAAPAYYLKEILGRAVSVSIDGTSDSATRRWVMLRSGDTSVIPLPGNIPELPAIGAALSVDSQLRLLSWSVTENDDGSLYYDATYGIPQADAAATGGGGEPDPADPSVDVRLESASWQGDRFEVDLTYDTVTQKPVQLPTGEPFESVPTTWLRGRTYEEVYLTKTSPGELLDASDTVNGNEVRLCGVRIPSRCGLLTVSAEEVLDDPAFKFRVTVSVSVKHNKVKLDPTKNEVTDIGHDTALLLQGFKYFDATGKLQTVMEPDGNGGSKPSSVPVLLDTAGKLVAEPEKGGYFMRVHVAPAVVWKKSWFVNVSK